MTSDRLSNTVLMEIGFMLLSEGKTVRIRADGNSMYPSIKAGSIIFVEPYEPETKPRRGDIIAWTRDSGFIVHRLVSIYSQKMQRHYVTRGDCCAAEDKPITIDQIVGKVVRVENPEGKVVPPEKYSNKNPNYSRNRRMLRIISQIYRLKRVFGL